MNGQTFSYMTFHHVRFPAPVSAQERSFDGPAAAIYWLFGPKVHPNTKGLVTRVSDEWSGAAFYPDLDAAERVMSDPSTMLPFVPDAIEAWHGLLCPIAHHGEVNWFNAPGDSARFVPVTEDPGGTMVVMTSAGYNTLPPQELAADIPRRIAFTAGVERVVHWYRTLPGNVASAAFSTGPVGRDGMTFSAWRDDASMAAAAYRTGVHREEMDRHKAAAAFDRSSFTRARILRSAGTWNGAVLA